MAYNKGSRTRINLNFPDDLLELVDEYAISIGTNRSVAINLIVRNFFDQREIIKVSSSLTDLLHSEELNKM